MFANTLSYMPLNKRGVEIEGPSTNGETLYKNDTTIISPIVSGIKYNIYNKKDLIQEVLLNGSQWSEEIVNIIKLYSLEKKLTHFLNVGSHIGSVCLPISLCIDKVTAIEAYPDSYNHLCDNIRLNNIKNICTFNIAVGNSEEDIYFISNEKICPVEKRNRFLNNTGGMHVFTENDINKNIRSAHLTDKKIKNKINKLDNLEIDNFDIMLVDIEGSEYDFLLGAEYKIKKNKPIIIIEIWDDIKRKNENMIETQEEVINYIKSLNYKLIKNLGGDFIFEPY
jgi:FkbM family methyltransferase